MAEVFVDRVFKRFGNVTAVNDLSLEIAAGEFVSILGPSGCGKTTLLRMLAGLEQPSEGTITMGGRVVNDLPPGKRDIAMVFQSYALYPHMTVAGNIEYPLRKHRVPKAERKEKVRDTAALLQLEGLLDRKPRQLSGGQQQRVALGRALVRDPSIFLLDEPLSNLDAKLRAHMRAELIQLHQRIGRTMIYVTHDQLEAMTMSNRIAVMRGGALQQFASPADVYARPANRFVAEFIGTPSMNLIDGTLSKGSNGVNFASPGLSLAIDEAALAGDFLDGEGPLPVTLGFRPDDIVLGDEGEEARVSVVEPAGHEVIVTFDLRGTAVVGRIGPDVHLQPGEAVRLSPSVAKLHIFDSQDGHRINAE